MSSRGSSCGLRRPRAAELEARPAGRVHRADRASVRLGERARGHEAEPDAGGLRREERLEEPAAHQGRDPRAFVRHLEDDLRALATHLDAQGAAVGHGLERVPDEVVEGALDLIDVHFERGHVAVVPLHAHALGQGRGGEHPIEDLARPHAPALGGAHAGVVEQARDDLVRAPDFLVDGLEREGDVAVGLTSEPSLEHVGRVLDRREGVPDLVRDASGELPEHREAFPAKEGLLGARELLGALGDASFEFVVQAAERLLVGEALGDVAREADRAFDRAVLVEHHLLERLDDAPCAAAVDVRLLDDLHAPWRMTSSSSRWCARRARAGRGRDP